MQMPMAFKFGVQKQIIFMALKGYPRLSEDYKVPASLSLSLSHLLIQKRSQGTGDFLYNLKFFSLLINRKLVLLLS